MQLWHQYDKYNLFLYSLGYFTFAGSMLFFLITADRKVMEVQVYVALFIQGLGMANIMNTSTSLVSEMIG